MKKMSKTVGVNGAPKAGHMRADLTGVPPLDNRAAMPKKTGSPTLSGGGFGGRGATKTPGVKEAGRDGTRASGRSTALASSGAVKTPGVTDEAIKGHSARNTANMRKQDSREPKRGEQPRHHTLEVHPLVRPTAPILLALNRKPSAAPRDDFDGGTPEMVVAPTDRKPGRG